MLLTPEQRVDLGSHFLTAALGQWRGSIDPESLELSINEDCILGQLFGDYHEGRYQLGLSREQAAMLGFEDDDVDIMDLLDAEWKRLLA